MINKSLLRKELRENLAKFAACFLLLLIAALVSAHLFHYAREWPLLFSWQTPPLGTFPGEALREPGIDYAIFSWGQWGGSSLYQLGTLTAILLAMGAFAHEKASSTLVFLSSTPLSRKQIFQTKAAAGFIMLAGCVFGSTVFLWLYSSFHGYTLPLGLFLLSAVLNTAGLAVVYLVSLIFSIHTNDPGRAGGYAALFWFALSSPGWFPTTKNLSLFYHLQGWGIILENRFPWLFFLVILVAAAAVFRAGQLSWQRQEV